MITLQIVGAWLVIGALLVVGLRLSERQYCAKTGEPRADVPLLVNAVLMIAWPLPIYLLWRLWTKQEHYRMCGWCRELLPDKDALLEHLKTCEAGPYKPLKEENARLHALLDGVTCAVCGRAMVEHEQRCEEG
jgi:hypothetical protein